MRNCLSRKSGAGCDAATRVGIEISLYQNIYNLFPSVVGAGLAPPGNVISGLAGGLRPSLRKPRGNVFLKKLQFLLENYRLLESDILPRGPGGTVLAPPENVLTGLAGESMPPPRHLKTG